MMLLAAALKLFLVTLQPNPGVPGGPQKVTVEARDANSAKLLAKAQYGSMYRVSNVAPTNRGK
jgi:hypothetical protein